MIESQNRINELNECIRNHVDDKTTWLGSCELRISSEYGCGIFATRDIEANELLFGDKPLMLGPSGNRHEAIVCAICYDKIENNLTSYMCPGQCGLVLCAKDVCADQHKLECKLLQKWKPKNPNEFSFIKTKAMVIIRSLLLDENQKKFLELLQKNDHIIKDEIYLDDEFEHFPQDIKILTDLRSASAAINTNAFKVLYRSDGSGDVCVRSFYPIMSLINHKCTPNTRHDTDAKFISRVSATRSIKKDEQIFFSYSQLLWGTNSRRMHMVMTKQFLCTCERCADPTENSTNLSAIRCLDKNCNGLVLPIDTKNLKSNAKCNYCEKICEYKQFLRIQDMSSTITRHFLDKSFTLAELKHFIEARLFKLVPNCSQFVIECKLRAIWKWNAENEEGFMLLLL